MDIIPFEFEPPNLTSEQLEIEVRHFLARLGENLTNFEALHDQVIKRPDGAYQIDVYVTFDVLGAEMRLLVECKHEKRPVEREVVQLLRAKLDSVGAQKGMIFSTAGFQSGALRYAKEHGIALVHIADGKATYIQKGMDKIVEYPPWVKPYVSLLTWLTENEEENAVSIGYNQEPSFEEIFGKANNNM